MCQSQYVYLTRLQSVNNSVRFLNHFTYIPGIILRYHATLKGESADLIRTFDQPVDYLSSVYLRISRNALVYCQEMLYRRVRPMYSHLDNPSALRTSFTL